MESSQKTEQKTEQVRITMSSGMIITIDDPSNSVSIETKDGTILEMNSEDKSFSFKKADNTASISINKAGDVSISSKGTVAISASKFKVSALDIECKAERDLKLSGINIQSKALLKNEILGVMIDSKADLQNNMYGTIVDINGKSQLFVKSDLPLFVNNQAYTQLENTSTTTQH